MSTRLIAPPDAVLKQRLASDPGLSAWVSANAGSGKTYVLARRVVRLMLAGTPPGAILCLTFTKAAAATMANRVFGLLAEWTALDDGALARTLEDLDGRKPGADRLLRARRLFAEALETPGGLKVQTIHAFCERVLHQFPFEANVASQFTVLDDTSRADLVQRAKLAVLELAAGTPDGIYGRALAQLSTIAADQTVDDLLSEALRLRDALPARIDDEAALTREIDALGDMLGLVPTDTEASLQAALVDEAILAASEWLSVALSLESLPKAGAGDRDAAARLRRAAGGETDAYLAMFLTQAGSRRKTIVTKAVQTTFPDLGQRLDREAERIVAWDMKRKAVAMRDRTAALLTLAVAVHSRVEAAKAARGALDFDDLVIRTRALFGKVDARWILYKLDQGIDHILVDEAQDTSPVQWELVAELVAEFTSGEGARPGDRTLFVVGDEKQSIYSFQGAEPAHFALMRRKFEADFRKASKRFETVPLHFSFRSTAAVLGAVDTVFEAPDARRGLVFDDDVAPTHSVARVGAPGSVELWPAVEPTDQPEVSPWTAPLDAVTPGDPVMRLAERIAGHIKLWRDQGHRLPDRDRPIAAGDILILVRRRGALFEAIIRALKNAQVPVAGADRMVLGEHIAVMDLLALADCLLTPDDDLSLAAVLKSPLIGMSEDALLALASGRAGSLWDALRIGGHPAANLLARWRNEVLASPPATFFAQVLSRDGGRRRILERLGYEAADALDEFLSRALAFEADEIPTMRGFLSAMRAADIEVKRDMDLGRNEVRVMTVHGAKGLEAEIVFLADTMSSPGGHHDPRLFRIKPPNSMASAPARLVWSPAKASDVDLVTSARDAHRRHQEDEYRRLLYVAMTRAADKLIICGARPKRGPKDAWYDMIAPALGPGHEEPADDGDGMVRRWPATPESATAPQARIAAERTAVLLPGWTRTRAPAPPVPRRTLTPSGFASAPGAQGGAAVLDREQALRRGTLVHRLLQSLPDVRPGLRAEAAATFLRSQSGLDEAAQAAIARSALALVEDARLAPLFGPTSRAEAAIAGDIAGHPVAGQIDRLAILPDRIVIADYKTNDPPPATPGDVPETYLVQLAIYNALIGAIVPGRPVETWLIWTATGELMVIPPASLDAALRGAGLA
ncbi:double-strand break repair helicase AddA [Phreatobacter aquaticus]|nr:double-strand break repair helicase AddA [Phreatobacter aquaticus]